MFSEIKSTARIFLSLLIWMLLMLVPDHRLASAQVCTGAEGFDISPATLEIFALKGQTVTRDFFVNVSCNHTCRPGNPLCCGTFQVGDTRNLPNELSLLKSFRDGVFDAPSFMNGIRFSPPRSSSDALILGDITLGPLQAPNCPGLMLPSVTRKLTIIGHPLEPTTITLAPKDACLFDPKKACLFIDPSEPPGQPIPVTFTISASGPEEVEITNLFVNAVPGSRLPDPNVVLLGNSPERQEVEQKIPISFTLGYLPVFVRPGLFVTPEAVVTVIGTRKRTMTGTGPATAGIIVNQNDLLTVPTLTQWGQIVMSMLMMAVGTVFVLRSRSAMTETAVVDGGLRVNEGSLRSLFELRVFIKTLSATLSVALIGIASVTWLSWTASALDIGGTLLCALILAYVIHLLILGARNSEFNRE